MKRTHLSLLAALGCLASSPAYSEMAAEIFYDFEEAGNANQIKDLSGKSRTGLTNETPGADGEATTQTASISPNGRYRFLQQKALTDEAMEVTILTPDKQEIALTLGSDYEVASSGIRLLRTDVPVGSQLRYTYRYFNEPLQREAGIKGSALRFDGVNDWIATEIKEPIDLSQGLTFSIWIKPDRRRSPIEILAGIDGQWGLSFYEDVLTFRFAGAFNGLEPKADRINFAQFTRPVDAWTHLAVVTDGQNVTLYVNGKETEVVSGVLNGPKPPTTQPVSLRIGGSGPYNYKGLIDEFQIFNRPLSAEEIASLAKP